MPDKRGRIAVIGGANMDIGGFPLRKLVLGDSNPGQIRMSAGGVGRNIAENMARMGVPTQLISAIGGDMNGRMLMEDCRAKGIGMDACLLEANLGTSVYLFLGDEQGDMYCAVNDMRIQERITPKHVEKHLDMLGGMDAVVLDANLPEETIRFAAENITVPVFADAVSAAKAPKLKPVLSKLYCLKPNRLEAELLTGIEIRDAMDAATAAKKLTDIGVQRVFLTMGASGAVCADSKQYLFLPNVPRSIVNATGAGDAFTAALVWAHTEGLDLRQSGLAGMAAASIAIESEETVNPGMSREKLMRRIQELQNN